MKHKNIWICPMLLFILLLSSCSGDIEPPSAEFEAASEIVPPLGEGSLEEEPLENKEPLIAEENKLNSEIEIDLSLYFENFSGSAVFLSQSGGYQIYNIEESERRFSPCSTFKIISTLAAFEYGVVTPENSFMEWDGTDWPIDSWNRDLTISEAFRSSCVWYYRKLIDGVGKENMAVFLEKLDYGNSDISLWEGNNQNGNAAIDGFWLDSSLEISPKEQVDVLCRIFEGETDIAKNSIIVLRSMMIEEYEIGGAKIYAKTGTGQEGWYVGFFEEEDRRTYFAVCLNEQEGASGAKAREIAEKIFGT